MQARKIFVHLRTRKIVLPNSILSKILVILKLAKLFLAFDPRKSCFMLYARKKYVTFDPRKNSFRAPNSQNRFHNTILAMKWEAFKLAKNPFLCFMLAKI